MSKLLSMREAIADLVPDGASVCMNCQVEQMIPFAAGHEVIRQKKRRLTLIGPISDILLPITEYEWTSKSIPTNSNASSMPASNL